VLDRTDTDDGISLGYRSVGDGPAGVLFLHGWAGSAAYFDETIGGLEPARTRAVSFDLRGHGASDKATTDFSLDRLAADTLTVMDATGLDEAVIVGFSMSGKFAQYVACLEPSRVRGQVLVAGSPAGEIALPDEMLDDWFSRAGSAERMIELVRAFVAAPVNEAALERFGRDAAAVPRSALEGTMSACIKTSFVDRLATMTTPTLVVGGVHDAIFTPDLLREAIVAQIPGARLALLDCGHEIPLEKPRELAALLEAFLAGLGTAPTPTMREPMTAARPGTRGAAAG
jgi:pimeloyl-ACP methyl ester carboxylesterase